MGIRSQNNQNASYLDKWAGTGNEAMDPAPVPSPGPNGHIASGGNIVEYKEGTDYYRAHIFQSSGTFVVTALAPAQPAHVEYLVVGGGGGA